MPKIVCTNLLLGEAAKRLRDSEHEVIAYDGEDECASREWVLEHVPGSIAVLVTSRDKIDAELLDTCGKELKIISTVSVGYDHVDRAALKERGVRLGHTPGVLTDAVADIAVMLVLMAQRRGGESMRMVLDGKWPSTPWRPTGLSVRQVVALTHTVSDLR